MLPAEGKAPAEGCCLLYLTVFPAGGSCWQEGQNRVPREAIRTYRIVLSQTRHPCPSRLYTWWWSWKVPGRLRLSLKVDTEDPPQVMASRKTARIAEWRRRTFAAGIASALVRG
jgi:hypothetical protein